MRYLGILGGGNISETHVRAALEIEGLCVTAICGRNPQKTGKLARETRATAYNDVSEFLNHQPMDIVAIGSPSGLHAEQGIAAARRGLHVLTEKPIDITTEKVDLLIDECKRAGVKLGVFFQDRVAPDLAELKGSLDRGELGEINLITGHVKWYRPPEYYGESRWRGTWGLDGGGAIMNQGIHTVDLMLWLGGPVRTVVGRTATRLHSIETEDTAVAIFEFQNGALGTFEAATSAYPGQPRRVVVSGSRGTAVIEHDKLASLDLIGADPQAQTEESKLDAGRNLSESSAVVSNVAGHRKILEDFLLAIESDRPPLCTGREARRSVELVQAIYRSAREGHPVDLGNL